MKEHQSTPFLEAIDFSLNDRQQDYAKGKAVAPNFTLTRLMDDEHSSFLPLWGIIDRAGRRYPEYDADNRCRKGRIMDIQYFKDSFHLNASIDAPIYEQLLSYFHHIIKTGEIQPGDRLVTEGAICDTLGISRTTVRQAMDQLVAEGLVIRQRGRGTFVADSKLHRSINHLYNFTDNMENLGVVPKSVVLYSAVDFVDANIRAKLNLPMSQDKVFHLTRLRCGDDEPILLEDTYVPYYLCEGIERVDFSNHSLYKTLGNNYSLSLYHATETLEAIIISKPEAELLRCKPKIAGYRITRTSHLDTGYVFEYTRSTTRSDRCVFTMELYNSASNSTSRPFEFQRTARL